MTTTSGPQVELGFRSKPDKPYELLSMGTVASVGIYGWRGSSALVTTYLNRHGR